MEMTYQKLHDGLSDMIESGRLVESDIPNDYRWLVDGLESLAYQQALSSVQRELREFDCYDVDMPAKLVPRYQVLLGWESALETELSS